MDFEIKEVVKQLIDELKATQKEEKYTIGVMRAAEISGIGRDTLLSLISQKNTDFPYIKVGNKTLIPVEPFKLWLFKIAQEHRKI